MQLSQKQKNFSGFFSAFLKSTSYFEHFRQKDDPHSWCISQNTDSVKQVGSISNRSRFRWPFKKQYGKRAKTLLKSERQHLYHIYWSLWKQLSFKKCPLEICKLLRLFVNTLTADDKYSLLNRDNLTQPIQTQLSQKKKLFLNFSLEFLKSNLNIEDFQGKDDPHSWCFSRSTDSVK